MTIKALLVIMLGIIASASGRTRDICSEKPTITGICLTSTLGIYYDLETQHCKYMGCSPEKKLFATLEDCEKICNNNRHRQRRLNTRYFVRRKLGGKRVLMPQTQ